MEEQKILCQEEEKNSIAQQRKSESNLVLGPDGSMHEIKTDSMTREWIDIGGQKKWIKKCPSCNKITWFIYKCLSDKHDGKMCRSCNATEHNKSSDMRKKVSDSKKGKINHFYGLTGDKNPANRPDIKKKLIDYQNRPDVKERRRRTYVDMMSKKRYPGGQFYNKVACEFMNKWGKENGYIFEHAMNGKELKVAAYWVDGYDKEKNIVFEYDEPHHYYKRKQMKLKEKDLIRMKRIQEEIHCDFIRYNEITKTITIYSFSK